MIQMKFSMNWSKVAGGVTRGGLFRSESDAVARGEFHHGGGRDGTFQMDVQFGLRERGENGFGHRV